MTNNSKNNNNTSVRKSLAVLLSLVLVFSSLSFITFNKTFAQSVSASADAGGASASAGGSSDGSGGASASASAGGGDSLPVVSSSDSNNDNNNNDHHDDNSKHTTDTNNKASNNDNNNDKQSNDNNNKHQDNNKDKKHDSVPFPDTAVVNEHKKRTTSTTTTIGGDNNNNDNNNKDKAGGQAGDIIRHNIKGKTVVNTIWDKIINNHVVTLVNNTVANVENTHNQSLVPGMQQNGTKQPNGDIVINQAFIPKTQSLVRDVAFVTPNAAATPMLTTPPVNPLPFQPPPPDKPVNEVPKQPKYDQLKNCAADQHTPTTAITFLTHFACGHVKVLTNGTVVRSFSLIAHENTPIPISDQDTKNPVMFRAWTFNGSIPGPTLRMTEGDHVFVTVANSKDSQHAHSFHMHSIHSGPNDGVTGMAGAIPPGHNFTYSFVAKPFGLYPYHCHVSPVPSHLNHGLYGTMIIDPKVPRTPAREMVMILNGYNLKDNGTLTQHPPSMQELMTNFDKATESDEVATGDNQMYTVNGATFVYRDHMIHLIAGVPYRIYLVNMLEFDLVNSFHLHGNMFKYFPSGTSETTYEQYNDILTLSQGDRGILEFTYPLAGDYMFHAHINRFTDLGWLGMFHVTSPTDVSALMPGGFPQHDTNNKGPPGAMTVGMGSMVEVDTSPEIDAVTNPQQIAAHHTGVGKAV